MKVFIVFDSFYGNGTKIANKIYDNLSKDNEVTIKRVQESHGIDVSTFDLVIIGSPTRGFLPSPDIKTFALELSSDMENTSFALYDTNTHASKLNGFLKFLIKMSGYSNDTLAKILKKKHLKLIASEKFYVMDTEGPLANGELKKASKYADSLK